MRVCCLLGKQKYVIDVSQQKYGRVDHLLPQMRTKKKKQLFLVSHWLPGYAQDVKKFSCRCNFRICKNVSFSIQFITVARFTLVWMSFRTRVSSAKFIETILSVLSTEELNKMKSCALRVQTTLIHVMFNSKKKLHANWFLVTMENLDCMFLMSVPSE